MSTTKQKNDWINKARDRINLTVPKGKKEVYAEYAKLSGVSMTKFIIAAIEEKAERDRLNK